ncbi:MAG: chromate resistance protein ChrB domain-containing protein [Burkholderiales bacterium]
MLNRLRRSGADKSVDAAARSPLARWLALIFQLPSEDAATRMTALRMFETLGACVLREGVYMLPESDAHRASFERLVEYIRSAKGEAHLLALEPIDLTQEREFRRRVDRGDRYSVLLKSIEGVRAGYGVSDPSALARIVQRQSEEFEGIATLDFFGSPLRDKVAAALAESNRAIHALMFPAGSTNGAKMRSRKEYFRKIWATRKPLVADRLASAWLIRRFIDAEAQLVWLDKTGTAAPATVTYGFDGAEFANTKSRVTFEALLHFFELQGNASLARIGTLVRAITTSDSSVPEAAGIETMLRGAEHRAKTDNELLTEVEKTFDIVYERYQEPIVTKSGPRP